MTEKRFHFGYVLGDTGLIDEQAEHKWFIENCCNITDLKKNWKTVCGKLNEVADENEQLKIKISDLRYDNKNLKTNLGSSNKERKELLKENEQLKKENELLKQDLEHCANQFTNDGKNVLLGLK